jgi:hypothetical protein
LWAHAAPTTNPSESATRGINLIIALMVIVTANSASKRVRPLASLRCDPVAEQAARRFTAMVLVVGGTVYALAWLLAPLSWAFPLSITALGAATAAGVIRMLAARLSAT